MIPTLLNILKKINQLFSKNKLVVVRLKSFHDGDSNLK